MELLLMISQLQFMIYTFLGRRLVCQNIKTFNFLILVFLVKCLSKEMTVLSFQWYSV